MQTTNQGETSGPVPRPTVMPVDREKWRQELHLSNFVNAYYQYRDIQRLPGIRNILIIGPGQGLEALIFKWKGYQVSTFDIDATFEPDHIGSVHDLSAFRDVQFDAVIASHVLEHLALPFLDKSLQELARVARYALVYLPIHRRNFHLRFAPGIRGSDISLIFDYFNWLERPDGLTPKYSGQQHFWEVGLRGFRLADIKARVSAHFEIVSIYRNRDWIGSQNLVLKSSRWR